MDLILKLGAFLQGKISFYVVSDMSLPSFVESFENLLSDLSKVWLISNGTKKCVIYLYK